MIELAFLLLLIIGIIALIAGLTIHAKTNTRYAMNLAYGGIVLAIVGVLGLGFYHPWPPPG